MMKSMLTVAAASLVMFSVSSASAQSIGEGSKTFGINASKSAIKFVSNAPAEKIQGTANGKISGEVTINLADVKETTGKISFPVDSMETGNKLRDRHMKGKDWLNAKKNPNVTFTLTGISDATVAGGAVTGVAVGKVNVNGKDADAKATIEMKYLAEKGLFKVEIKDFKVKLANHDVAGKKGVVGNKVGETIEITGVIYGKAK
jgi:polyisoprenoid-binding protein YceI